MYSLHEVQKVFFRRADLQLKTKLKIKKIRRKNKTMNKNGKRSYDISWKKEKNNKVP